MSGVVENSETPAKESSLSLRLRRELPYFAMLSTALIGVAMVSFTGQPMSGYWFFLSPFYAAMCIVAGWPRAESRVRRLRLIWKQALHWTAFLLAMLLVTSPQMRGVENNNAAGLNLMTILAAGTFAAGIHAEAWEIGVVGALLACAAPMILWIERSALLMAILAVLAIFLIVAASRLVSARK
jgi:hypothetical protein